MLTPTNIKNHHFQNLGRGFYKTSEVDDYMHEVYTSYSLVFRENKELIRKLNILASKIEEYRDDEENIKNAIINARHMASKLIDEARKEAENIIDAAEMRAQSADSITNARIKKKIDEVELLIKDTFDKARLQAKRAAEKAESDANALVTDAKIKASEIIENAARNSKKQLSGICEEINAKQAVLNNLKEESEAFKKAIIKRYEDQIYLISHISDIAMDELESSFPHSSSENADTNIDMIDDIINSLYNERISLFNNFSSSLEKIGEHNQTSDDSNIVFEDVYSSDERKMRAKSLNSNKQSDDLSSQYDSGNYKDISSDYDDTDAQGFDFDESDDGILSDTISQDDEKMSDGNDIYFSKENNNEDVKKIFGEDEFNLEDNEDKSDFEVFDVGDRFSDDDFSFVEQPDNDKTNSEVSHKTNSNFNDMFELSIDDMPDNKSSLDFNFISDDEN